MPGQELLRVTRYQNAKPQRLTVEQRRAHVQLNGQQTVPHDDALRLAPQRRAAHRLIVQAEGNRQHAVHWVACGIQQPPLVRNGVGDDAGLSQRYCQARRISLGPRASGRQQQPRQRQRAHDAQSDHPFAIHFCLPRTSTLSMMN